MFRLYVIHNLRDYKTGKAIYVKFKFVSLAIGTAFYINVIVSFGLNIMIYSDIMAGKTRSYFQSYSLDSSISYHELLGIFMLLFFLKKRRIFSDKMYIIAHERQHIP